MSKRLIAVLAGALLLLSLAATSFGQVPTTTTTTTTKVETVQNADGTFTIVEYPVGKETVVTLTPVNVKGATGTATILRAADGTTIKVNLTGLPTEVAALNLYAVDPTGAVTLLGPIAVASGAGTFTTTTPLSRFMLITSPEAALAAYDASTTVLFRSAVPTGLSVIPLSGPVGDKVAATTAPTTEAAVPMLGIPNLKLKDDTELKVNFTGEMAGARANIFITPEKEGRTKVKVRFHELKDAASGNTYILWAVSPDGQFQNLGQVVNLKDRHEAEVNAEVPFPDFGLFVTTEPIGTFKTIVKPAGARVGFIEIVP
ncbi:MAG TPA: hypothetical protein VFZ40_13820 [Pyrinomonadaceae bacterium]